MYNFAPKLFQHYMKNNTLLLIVGFLVLVEFLPAQQNAEEKPENFFESFEKSDSTSKATVKIHQDKRIESLVVGNRIGNGLHSQVIMSGYRVQVFSSNTQRTAKSEAFKKEKLIREEFPDQSVYVNYTSPFWKVRVGDFKTQTQAQNFRKELISAFPYMRSEVYVVREKIIISGSK